MNRKCVQCNKNFTISDSEIKFYESKNLSLPKRCKECREKNKKSGNHPKDTVHRQGYKSYYARKGNNTKLATLITAIIIVLASILIIQEPVVTIAASLFAVVSLIIYILSLGKNSIFIQEFDTSIYKYTFYDTNSMVKHYIKHGDQTNCNSMEDYLYKANMVIIDKASLSKVQKKDGDLIYYNNKTKEFVVVAKAGYVRTYFIASDKYYNKQ